MKKSQYRGFTLIELLVVVVVVGLLASVVAPSWLRFLTIHQVTAGKDLIRQDIQKAQMKAQQESVPWQFSVRERAGLVEVAVHPMKNPSSTAVWTSLNRSVQLDEETSLAESGSVYYVQFDEKGNVRYRLGRVTLSGKKFPNIKRCVVISTLIGNTRAAKEQAEPKGGKYCY